MRAAVGRGADGLAMAGGDGSQALVAAIAAEHDLPYACIPSGTRNHFALDLGVDREDVVGALEAFVDGGERYVDLGEVNGQGLRQQRLARRLRRGGQPGRLPRGEAADAARHADRTRSGPTARPASCAGPTPTAPTQVSTALILVSNNPYLLGPTLGSGTRPRLDTGMLGIVDFHPPIAGKRRAGGPLARAERRRSWRSRPRRRSRSGSTARRWCWSRRCDSGSARSALRVADRPRSPRRVALGRRPAGPAQRPEGSCCGWRRSPAPRSADSTHDNGGYVNPDVRKAGSGDRRATARRPPARLSWPSSIASSNSVGRAGRSEEFDAVGARAFDRERRRAGEAEFAAASAVVASTSSVNFVPLRSLFHLAMSLTPAPLAIAVEEFVGRRSRSSPCPGCGRRSRCSSSRGPGCRPRSPRRRPGSIRRR